MTYEDVFTVYKPKEGYSILRGTLSNSGRYFASIFKEKVISTTKLGRKEIANLSIATVAETSVDNYIKKLHPYIELRIKPNEP